MSDPVRWKDGGGPEGASRLLAAAAPPRPMTAAERARTASRVAQIAPGTGAAGAGAAGGGAWVKVLAVIAGLGVAAAALRPLSTDVRAPAPADPPGSSTAAATAEPQETPLEPRAPAAAPVPIQSASSAGITASARPSSKTAPVRPAPGLASSGGAAASDALLEEAESLERARARLGADPAGALTVLADHQRRFPRGQLGAEREVLTIDALSRLGRREEARARAQAFLARNPSSPYAAKIARAAPAEHPPDAGTTP